MASQKGHKILGKEKIYHERLAHMHLAPHAVKRLREALGKFDESKLDEICGGCLQKAHNISGAFKKPFRKSRFPGDVICYDLFWLDEPDADGNKYILFNCL